MSGTSRRLILLPVVLAAVSACNSQVKNATEIQQTRMDDMKWELRPHLTYMVDNAMLHDMSIADIHFVPHTSELSGTGIVKLDRFAILLDTYGGTLRYDTFIEDEELIEQRLEHTREYLAMAGCDMSRVRVETMMPGGRGLPAVDAIEAKERAETQASGSQAAGMMMPIAGQ